MKLENLLRPELLDFAPYSSARMEAGSQQVMLNANESPWPPVGDTGLGLNRYPEPQPAALCARLAELYAVRPQQLLLGRGSDEAIDLLVRAFCRPGMDAVAVHPPTFGMYAVCARVQGAAVVEMPVRGDFTLDAEQVLRALPAAVKLVFLCSPNNPTGTLIRLAEIRRMAEALGERALVVVDEAYIEFADSPSASCLLSEYPNLAVLRTLSKAWALAGARLGCLLGSPELVAWLRRIMSPYPLPTPSVDAAIKALAPPMARHLMQARVASLVAERARMVNTLREMSGVRRVHPSAANFLAVELEHAATVYRGLLARGIVVRDLSRYPGLREALRLSLGTRGENDRLLAALEATIREAGRELCA